MFVAVDGGEIKKVREPAGYWMTTSSQLSFISTLKLILVLYGSLDACIG